MSEQRTMDDKRDEIVRAVAELGGEEVTASHVAARLGKKHSQVVSLLFGATKRGLLEREWRGKLWVYRLPSNA